MADEGATGLSTTALVRCLELAARSDRAALAGAAEKELAALVAQAGRATGLAAALTEARAYIASLDGRELVGAGRALRLDARALLRRLDVALADGGPGE